jgi:hypothetical protein
VQFGRLATAKEPLHCWGDAPWLRARSTGTDVGGPLSGELLYKPPR